MKYFVDSGPELDANDTLNEIEEENNTFPVLVDDPITNSTSDLSTVEANDNLFSETEGSGLEDKGLGKYLSHC